MSGRRDTRYSAACHDCGTDTLPASVRVRAEYYMVHDKVWTAAHAPKRGYLCIGCLEHRLGRQLHRGDFAKVPINNLVVSDTPRYAWSWRTRRLRGRLTAPDPVRDGIQLALWDATELSNVFSSPILDAHELTLINLPPKSCTSRFSARMVGTVPRTREDSKILP